MLSKTQLVVTVVSILLLSLITNFLWFVISCCPGVSVGVSASIITVYAIIVLIGFMALIKQYGRSKNAVPVTCCNIVATFNCCISVTGVVFIYFENGSRFSPILFLLLMPLFVGLLLFEQVFVSRKTQQPVK